jgi:acid stress chaperone HdeB
MKRYLLIAIASLCVGFAGQATAKEVDMSKLTCKEVGAMPPARIAGVAMWMSGYVHGKAGNTMVDSEAAHANAEKIAAYCKSNASATLASAVDAVFKK